MRLPDPNYEDPGVGSIPPIFRRLANLVEPFRPASGPPPGSFWPFLRWALEGSGTQMKVCLLYTSPSPRDRTRSRMPSSA